MRILIVDNVFKGVANEAVSLLLWFAFEYLRVRRCEWLEFIFFFLHPSFHFLKLDIIRKHHHLNPASGLVAKSVGFVQEGIFRNHMWVKGANRDTVWYAVTSDDYWDEHEDVGISHKIYRRLSAKKDISIIYK
jgi:hypothetical protein